MPALPSGVRIVLAKCDRIVARKALLEKLRVELLSTGIVEIDVVDPEDGAGKKGEAEDRLATLHMYFPECDDAAGLVYLRISDRLTAKYVERAMDVSDVGLDARPRAVALAFVELLRASWLELVLQPEAWEEEAGPAPAVRHGLVTRLKEATGEQDLGRRRPRSESAGSGAQQDAAALERWQRPRLEWTANMRFYPQGASGIVNTDLAVSIPMGRRLRLAVGGNAGGGGISDPYDDINLFVAAGRLGLVLASSGEPTVELQTGIEGGWAQATGTLSAEEGGIGKQSSATMTALLVGALRTHIAAALDALIAVQAGFVLSPLEAQVRRSQLGDSVSPEVFVRSAGGMVGPYLGISLGLSGRL